MESLIPTSASAAVRSLWIAAYLGAIAALAVTLVALSGGVLSWAERRIAGRMQSRIGPNRVGPAGFLQWLADGLKLILKEDFIPQAADPLLFRLAPYIIFLGMFLTVIVLPFGDRLIVYDLNLGIVYLLAISSVVVIGIVMSGWASNNKWSVLGCFRSAAQLVSYEVPRGLAALCVILTAGSFSMQDIVRSQSGGLLGVSNWFIFHHPFLFVSFFVFYIASLAEINRTPFDLPEAETELVAGYNTEYSGFRFAAFFLSEWANILITGVIAATLFLGGWSGPTLFGKTLLPGAAWICLKAGAVSFLTIWLRWTLPRLRVDQLMNVCWKYLVPISLASLVGTAVWTVVFRGRGAAEIVMEWIR